MANLKMTCPFWEDHPSFRHRSSAYDFSLMTHMGSLDFCYDLSRFCSAWSNLSISGFVSVSWGWPVPYHWLHASDFLADPCVLTFVLQPADSVTHTCSVPGASFAQFWCFGLKRVPTVGLLVSGHDLPSPVQSTCHPHMARAMTPMHQIQVVIPTLLEQNLKFSFLRWTFSRWRDICPPRCWLLFRKTTTYRPRFTRLTKSCEVVKRECELYASTIFPGA